MAATHCGKVSLRMRRRFLDFASSVTEVVSFVLTIIVFLLGLGESGGHPPVCPFVVLPESTVHQGLCHMVVGVERHQAAGEAVVYSGWIVTLNSLENYGGQALIKL